MACRAAIDCGTNALRMLIVRDGHEVTRLNEIVRLGEGVDETGRLSEAAIERVRVVLERYAGIMKEEGVDSFRMIATSATRDAENKQAFFDMTTAVLGQPAEVISGEEEARLSFVGATLDLDGDRGPVCVIDLGGGSTEFMMGDGSKILGVESVPMGCVRLTERFLVSEPPKESEITSARAYTRVKISEIRDAVPVADAKTVVGVAGTFTTLGTLALGLDEYDSTKVHNAAISASDLRKVTESLLSKSAEERRSISVMDPGRADVIGGGCIVVEEILNALGKDAIARGESADDVEIVISEKDSLDGIVAELG